MKNSTICKWLCIIVGVLLLSACSYEQASLESRQDRAKDADENNSPIIIGIAWPPAHKNNLVTGAELAVKEWNQQCILNSSRDNQKLKEQCGLLLNRKIELKKEPLLNPQEDMPETQRRQAEHNETYEITQKFAKDLNVIAVIGHPSSLQAIQASITYEQHGIVFLAPTATNLALTNHNFKYIFRLMPNDEELSVKMTDYFKDNNYKRVAILYERSVYAEAFAETFMKNSLRKFDIIFQHSFFQTEEDFTEMLAKLKEKSFLLDAIFLVASSEKACKVIKQAHFLDIKMPFVGADAVFKADMESCPEAEGTVVPTILDESKLNTFKEKHEKEINVESISNSEYQAVLLGYDVISLLVDVINQIKSTEPLKIANQLRYMDPWRKGTIGEYAFKEDGNLQRENAVNFAILCKTALNPKKLFFKISSDPSLKCDTSNLRN